MPISSLEAAASQSELSQLTCVDGVLYWLESDPSTNQTHLYGLDTEAQKKPVRLSPDKVSIGSRVNEYGGVSYCICPDSESGTSVAVVVNEGDQQLWLLQYSADLGKHGASIVKPLTSSSEKRFGAPVFDRFRNRVVVLVEEYTDGDKHPRNYLASICLQSGDEIELHSGFDFYDQPVLSPNGRELSWVAWNHPNQPWTHTLLCSLSLGETALSVGEVDKLTRCIHSPSQSITQPRYDGQGHLHVLSDMDGWWGLYRVAGDSLKPMYPVDQSKMDACAAPWQFGQSSYVELADCWCIGGHIGGWGQLTRRDESGLAPLDSYEGTTQKQDAYSLYRYLCASQQQLFCIASSPTQPDAIVGFEFDSCQKVFISSPLYQLASELNFATNAPASVTSDEGDDRVQGFLWQTSHPDKSTARLIVSIHGGPTSAAYPVFNAQRCFWLSHGFDVLEINHRGSTGFGRRYRQALKGEWGRVDVEDTCRLAEQVLNGYDHPLTYGFVRGSSAGGFTALNCLAASDIFAGGASLYGVTDLALLHQCTHKFESNYIPWLIGQEGMSLASAAHALSPLAKVKQITQPVLLLQGEQDRVVPKTQTQVMYEALVNSGGHAEVHYFEGERHGFKKTENRALALEMEYEFYNKLACAVKH